MLNSPKRRQANDKKSNTLLVYFIYGTAPFLFCDILPVQ